MLTDNQAREVCRFDTLDKYLSLTDNQTIINTNVPFKNEYTEYEKNLTGLKALIPAKDYSAALGITADKDSLKETIADELEFIGNNAKGYAKKVKNSILEAEMDFTRTTIMRLGQNDVLPFAVRVQKLLTPLLSDAVFMTYSIDAATLTQAVTDATTFDQSIGKASSTNSTATIANQNINAGIKTVISNIDMMDLLIVNFKTTYPDFYSGYNINSQLDNTGVRHNHIEGVITDATTGKAIAKATITYTKGKVVKTVITDDEGSYSFSPVPMGNATLDVVATGHTEKIVHVNVSRGQTVEVDVAL